MKAVIYARYSSDSQREESIEGQLRECAAFAEKNGITVLRHYIDRAYSAKTDNRPEFQSMIKDSGKLIGLLCINFDDSRYRAISDHILKLCHPDLFVTDVLAQPLPEREDDISARSSPEKFRNSADAVALDAINRELERMGVTPEQLTPEKRLQVITALEAGGLFLLKGAVKSAAASLHCSPASVYRYITQIKNSDSGQI